MLTELAVVLSLDLASLALASLLARRTFGRASASSEVRRLVSAATRASEGFLWREAKLAGVGLGFSVLLVVGLHGAVLVRHGAPANFSMMAWTIVAAVGGAALTCALAYLATELGLGAMLRTLRALHLSLDHSCTLALSAGGVTALVAEAIGSAAVAACLGLLYLLAGGTAAAPGETTAVLERAAAALPGLAIGTLGAALVLGIGGATYHVSSKSAGRAAGNLEAGDPRSPAMVADLVGDHAGLGARRAVNMFASSTLASVSLVLLGVSAFRAASEGMGARAWALVTLPLVVRAVGLVATALGLLTARVREAERASLALWRGHVTTSVLVLGGAAGASMWLLGASYAPWLAAAAGVGVLAAAVFGHSARYGTDRRFRPLQDVLDGQRAGPAVGAAQGLGQGLRASAVPVMALALALALAWTLGTTSGLPGCALLAPALALAAAASTGGYVLALGLVEPVASGMVGLSSLEPDASRSDVRRRIASLDDAGFDAGAVSDSFFAALGFAAALLSGLGIRAAAGLGAATAPTHPAAIASGLLGAVLVLSLSGRSLETAARAARGAVLEVERQLRSFPRSAGVPQVPEGFTPSYRTVIDLTARLSADGIIPLVLLGVFAPALLGIALRVVYRSADLALDGVTALVLVASVTGLGIALSGLGARTVLGAAFRASRPRGAQTGLDASLEGRTVGAFVGDLTSISTQLFVKAAASAALVIAPFLSRL